jgi:hypothetical protein
MIRTDRGFPAAGTSMKEIASPPWNTTFGVPLFRSQKILAVTKKPLLNLILENDAGQRTALARAHEIPLVLSIGGEDVDPVLASSIVSLLCGAEDHVESLMVPAEYSAMSFEYTLI